MSSNGPAVMRIRGADGGVETEQSTASKGTETAWNNHRFIASAINRTSLDSSVYTIRNP